MSKSKSIIVAVMVFVLLSFFSCQKVKLTEKEQKTFAGCIEWGSINREDALKYLHILVKGDPETIHWYKKYKVEDIGMVIDKNPLYQMDICTLIQILSQKEGVIQVISGQRYMMQTFSEGRQTIRVLSKEEIKKIEEAYKLILEVIKKKVDYPRARLCAIRAISGYGEVRDDKWYGNKKGIPVLKKALRDKDPMVQLESATALLSMGRGDIALPVLDELVKAGKPYSISALDRLFLPSGVGLRDERGKNILIKALNYSSLPNGQSGNEIRAYSALKLAVMGIEKKQAEETAIKVLEELSDKKANEYKDVAERDRDNAAGNYAIAVLERLKSTRGINILKLFTEKSDNLLLQKRAKMILENSGIIFK